jgi:hypothetical protein
MHHDKFSPRALHDAKGPPAADGDMVHRFVGRFGLLRDIRQGFQSIFNLAVRFLVI